MLSRDFIRADAERLERQLRPDEERMKKRAAMLSSQAHKRALRRRVPGLFHKKRRLSPTALHCMHHHTPRRSPLSSALDLPEDEPVRPSLDSSEATPPGRCFTPQDTQTRRAEAVRLVASGDGSALEVGYLNRQSQREREKAAENIEFLRQQLKEAKRMANKYCRKAAKLHAATVLARERADVWEEQLRKEEAERTTGRKVWFEKAVQETAKADMENIPS